MIGQHTKKGPANGAPFREGCEAANWMSIRSGRGQSPMSMEIDLLNLTTVSTDMPSEAR